MSYEERKNNLLLQMHAELQFKLICEKLEIENIEC